MGSVSGWVVQTHVSASRRGAPAPEEMGETWATRRARVYLSGGFRGRNARAVVVAWSSSGLFDCAPAALRSQ